MPAPATAIPFQRRDAWRGMFWLRQAYAMFRAAPLRWLLLIAVYYLILVFAVLGPWPAFGPLAVAMLKPVFAVGFLAAAWRQERGGKPGLADLFRGFRSNLWALLPLGLVYLAGMTLAIAATTLIDGGELIALAANNEQRSAELLTSGRLHLALLFGIACALPTLLALWFAPALVVFHDAGALTALGTSLRAAVANWRAVSVFGSAILFYGGIVPALGSALAGLLENTVGALLLLGFLVPYAFIFAATFQIADYVAYRDVFHADEPPPSEVSQAG